MGYEHPGHPRLSGPALACRMCAGKNMQLLLQCALWFWNQHKTKNNLMQLKCACDSPVKRSSVTSIIEQSKGSKVSVHVGFQAQRAVPQVVPSPLIQEHHLGQNTGSNSYWQLLTLCSSMCCTSEICGSGFGLTHLDDVTMETKEQV